MSTVGGVPLPIVALDNTYGALFICLLAAAMLFGLTNLQVVVYFQTQWTFDPMMYRLTVIWLWLLDAIQLAFTFHMLYHYLISNFGNPLALLEIVWTFQAQIAIGVIVVLSVHSLYAHRLWILGRGKSRIFSVVQIIIVTLGSGFAIFLCYIVFKCQFYKDFEKIQWEIVTAVAVVASNDLLIAASMSYLLVSSQTGFTSTNNVIRKIIIYVCSTGCLTSLCSLSVMILCAVMPKNFIFLGLDFLLAKLYVNSFLALLNSRSAKESFGDENSFAMGTSSRVLGDREHQINFRITPSSHGSLEK